LREFNGDIEDIIRNRKSCRSYSDRKIGNDVMDEVVAMLKDVESIASSFRLTYLAGSGPGGKERVGT
jgi:nitroreductase